MPFLRVVKKFKENYMIILFGSLKRTLEEPSLFMSDQKLLSLYGDKFCRVRQIFNHWQT